MSLSSDKTLRRKLFSMTALTCFCALFCASCGTVQVQQPPLSEECKAQHSYTASDRYIYPPLQPPGITAYPRNIPDSLILTMSTQGLLESCLANPHTRSTMMLRKSLAKGRTGLFTLNTWQALELRTDAYRVMIERYDRLEAACSSVVQAMTNEDPWAIQIQLSLIELALTRESFLNRLSILEKRQLVIKVLAKHRQKTLYNFDTTLIGTGDGLWLLSSLMLSANDVEFTDAVRSNRLPSLSNFAQGEIGTAIVQPSFEVESTILRHAERFAAGR
jgi:hypothetical protein